MFQVGLLCYMRLNSGRSVSIDVNKTRKPFPETFRARACFLDVSHFPIRENCFQCQFLFHRRKLYLPYTPGSLNENPSMPAVAILRAIRAKATFCEHFQFGWGHSIPLVLITRQCCWRILVYCIGLSVRSLLNN